MHASSLENMQRCYEKFVKNWQWQVKDIISVIDIGGLNVNGSYADIFSGKKFLYQSADIESNENVDILLNEPYKLPFADNSVDIIISGQAFEHVEFFWLLFAEMVRVLKSEGLMILIAPSAGPIHNFPVDCYRFYPDAYRALAKYTECNLLEVKLDERGPWKDLVGVFCKRPLSEAKKLLNKESNILWEPNLFELEVSPVALFEKDRDEVIDLVKGDFNYIEVLGKLHQELQPDNYLEIGVRQGRSLQLAKCQAVGIDPDFDIKVQLSENHKLICSTSDKYFEESSEIPKIDLAFIDGMHLFEFALRDFINIEKHSSPHTVVVIDDIYPNHPVQAERSRSSRVWTGDIWKLSECLKKARPDLNLTYLDCSPTGLLIITGLKNNNKVLVDRYNPLVRQFKAMYMMEDTEELVINRSLAIDSYNTNYWQWLISFVQDVESVPKSKNIQHANTMITNWKKMSQT